VLRKLVCVELVKVVSVISSEAPLSEGDAIPAVCEYEAGALQLAPEHGVPPPGHVPTTQVSQLVRGDIWVLEATTDAVAPAVTVILVAPAATPLSAPVEAFIVAKVVAELS
jgi:hypothetical protein